MLGDDEPAKSSRRITRMQIVGKHWGAISAAIRSERAKAGALKIKDRWGHPSSKSMRDRWGMPWLDHGLLPSC
jgi:hypothetical protein